MRQGWIAWIVVAGLAAAVGLIIDDKIVVVENIVLHRDGGAANAARRVFQADERRTRHVGIIMDGNGRWAEARGLPRISGHREGSESVRAVAREARKVGLEALTPSAVPLRVSSDVRILMRGVSHSSYVQRTAGSTVLNGRVARTKYWNEESCGNPT